MCGLAGLWDPAGGTPGGQVVDAMVANLGHRGPDDAGTWHDGCGSPVLGHRRLAVQDLSQAGHQPMQSRSGRFTLVLNGEIYNHFELRSALGARSWRGHSDTESLVEAIDTWGLEQALQRSNGMFALAVWDSAARRLSLARDRVGEKPLYWGIHDGVLLFASELGALLRSGLGPFEVNSDAVRSLLHLGYVPDPLSAVQPFEKLRPGTWIDVEVARGTLETKQARYWDLESTVVTSLGRRQPSMGAEEWLDAVAESLTRSIEMRLISDVPLGAFLSGGVDSGLIVALMSRISSVPVRTFTVRMPTGTDEGPRARELSEYFGTHHTEIPITESDCLEIIPRLAKVFSEPLGDSSQIPTYLVSEVTRRAVTVALSGDGGDELFAGYHRHFQAREIWSRVESLPRSARAALSAAVHSSPGRAAGVAASLLASGLGRDERRMLKVQKGLRLLAAVDVPDLYSSLVSQWPEGLSPTLGDFWRPELPTWPGSTPGLDVAERLMAYDLLMALPGDMLVKVDRASMAHSLETRVPFLDHELIALAFEVPVQFKIRDGLGKWLLRELLARYAPAGWMERPQARAKSGFGIPLNRWLRGDLRDWAESLLHRDRLCQSPFLDPETVQRRWQELQRGTRAWQHPFWSILMFQAWVEEYGEHLTFGDIDA